MEITVNSDMGEGLGLHRFGFDGDLMPHIHLANIACGFHASDPQVMSETVKLAKENKVRIGAHPGLPDLAGFGRRKMALETIEVENLVRYQVGALTGFLKGEGLELNHIKPHGALFGMVNGDESLMNAVVRVARDYGVPILGLFSGVGPQVCADNDVEFIPELYVDLNYDSEGNLIIERVPQPTTPEAAYKRVKTAIETGTVRSTENTSLEVNFKTVCIHSDNTGALEITKAVRSAIDEAQSITK